MRLRTWLILILLVAALAAEAGAIVWLSNSDGRLRDDIQAALRTGATLREELLTTEEQVEELQDEIESATQETSSLREELKAARSGDGVTLIQLFEPFDAQGLLGASVRARETSGDCESGSFADSGRPEAWRCFAGNEIHDPCFESPDRAVVACFDSPDQTSDVVVITPNAPLPPAAANGGSPEDAPPWQIQLTDGRSCFYMGGATFAIGDLRANFSCDGGGVVFGEPDRSTPQWTIAYAPGEASDVLEQTNSGALTESTLQRVPIAIAWY